MIWKSDLVTSWQVHIHKGLTVIFHRHAYTGFLLVLVAMAMASCSENPSAPDVRTAVSPLEVRLASGLNGQPITATKVIAVQVKTGTRIDLASQGDGVYSNSALPGLYEIQVSAEEFVQSRRSLVWLAPPAQTGSNETGPMEILLSTTLPPCEVLDPNPYTIALTARSARTGELIVREFSAELMFNGHIVDEPLPSRYITFKAGVGEYALQLDAVGFEPVLLENLSVANGQCDFPTPQVIEVRMTPKDLSLN